MRLKIHNIVNGESASGGHASLASGKIPGTNLHVRFAAVDETRTTKDEEQRGKHILQTIPTHQTCIAPACVDPAARLTGVSSIAPLRRVATIPRRFHNESSRARFQINIRPGFLHSLRKDRNWVFPDQRSCSTLQSLGKPRPSCSSNEPDSCVVFWNAHS
jgi:hypothetical protein